MDNLVTVGFGIFLFIGAFFGWKAGSRVSLIMGLVSGVLVLLGSSLVGSSPKTGFLFLTVIGAVLVAAFFMRLKKTKKFMPSGMLLGISVLFLIFCLCRYLNV